MFATVIFTTYNHPKWLEKTLRGFAAQSYREFGERLINMGIKPRQVRYRCSCSCSCVHLDHGRGYAHPESIAKNRGIRQQTHGNKATRTDFGIETVANEAGGLS
jgi:hypothetical protein